MTPVTMQEEEIRLVAAEFARLEEISGQTLIWNRPNYFELRYELTAPRTGLLVRMSVRGIGTERRLLAETPSGSWTFEAFPADRRVAPIRRLGGGDLVASYYRDAEENSARIEFAGGQSFDLEPLGPVSARIRTREAAPVPILFMAQAEFFPRWRVEMKLEPGAGMLPELPVLLAAACCYLVVHRGPGGGRRVGGPRTHQP